MGQQGNKAEGQRGRERTRPPTSWYITVFTLLVQVSNSRFQCGSVDSGAITCHPTTPKATQAAEPASLCT
jgi:hypothetical protein